MNYVESLFYAKLSYLSAEFYLNYVNNLPDINITTKEPEFPKEPGVPGYEIEMLIILSGIIIVGIIICLRKKFKIIKLRVF